MSERFINSILVRGVNWIGDAVMTIPAIRALKRAHKGTKISLLVKPAVVPVFEGDPHVDEIIVYEERFEGPVGKLQLACALRKKRFSKAILLQNAFDAALIAFLAGIPERIGYNRDGRGFLLTKPIAYNNDDRKIHHITYYLNLLNAAGIPADYRHPWIYLALEERLATRERIALLNRPVLGINPGATFGSAKRWLPGRFAEVAGWFIKETKGSVLIFGGKSEMAIAEAIEKLAKGQLGVYAGAEPSDDETHMLMNVAGKTSLRELMALIAECDVLLTNDSGPMHLAYGVGTPVVAIFGSTAPDLTGPVGYRNTVIKKDFSCSPCFERTCTNGDLRCMYTVTSEEVFFKIKDMLPRKRAVFFDRDGTLCRDAHYLNNWKDFEVFHETKHVRTLKEAGFSIIGITNQSGIDRGLVSESFVKDVNKVFTERYGFDDFYYCPHGPDELCSCRKPEPDMLLKARALHGINLRQSYVVGDKDADMLLAKAVGAQGILVTTGKQKESPYADVVVDTLKDAVKIIMAHENNQH
ncbi:MAG: lipopolysaccharide heptosyltransferase II [Nitrospirota bacterium]